jgi:penicillin-binding protein 2
MSGLYARLRTLFLRIVVMLGFALVGLRLWNLQVVSSGDYADAADRNRYRLVATDAPRGVIYDRVGRLLVRNVPGFTVSIVPGDLPREALEREAVLARLAELLGMPLDSTDPEGLLQILEERTTGPYVPVRIATGVDRQVAFVIEEQHLELPGVVVAAEPERRYDQAPLMAHIIGYMGRISDAELDDYVAQGYAPDDWVGVAGIERTQEAVLAGIKGQKHIEVNVYGREMAVISERPPQPGHSIYLTVDTAFQQAVEEALQNGMAEAESEVGVAIAMDPRTGEVLAMVSLPTFDNNLFSGGISAEDYAALNEDPRHPLVDHAVSGQYPPGSTFKIVPAAAVLQEDVVTPSTTFECRGTMLLPNRYFPDDMTQAQPFYCWSKVGHGHINLMAAIAQSCDIYFYQATGGFQEFAGLGMTRLGEYARMFGFGEPTGVELSGEASGLVPTDRWKRRVYGESWYTGDTYNASIGQGFILATPLQLLNATSAIANGGTLYRPQLIAQEVDIEGNVIRALEPDVIRELAVSPENIELVRRGMRQAVTGGTAWRVNLSEIEVAAKTGTAEYTKLDEQGQVIMDEQGYLPTHAWFTAFAPYDEPEIVIVVFLDDGGEGSQYAAPVGEEILRAYFGIPRPDPNSEQEPQEAVH